MKNMCFVNVSNHEKQLPYYLYGAATDYDQEEVLRPYGCNWYQLNICLKGEAVLSYKGFETTVKEGDAIIIYPDTAYTYRPISEKLTVSWIAFDGFQVKSMLHSIGVLRSGVYRFHNKTDIYNRINETLYIQQEHITEQGYAGSSYVFNFLLTLSRSRIREDDLSIEKIRPAIDFMSENLHRVISIEDIADSMGISSQHFCLLFKSIMKQRPFEYLNTLRISRAKNLLLNRGDLSIKEIANLSGYVNHGYFTQLFKKSERLTPVKFRDIYRKS